MSWKQHSNRESFLENNVKDLCLNKNVLDFCCGTGMNGIDALKWGASHVTFTDVRPKTFEDYILDEENSEILNENNHEWKYANADDIKSCYKKIDLENLDIIIYHGHFYHARNHRDIIKMFADSSAEYIVFETKGHLSKHAYIDWHIEDTADIWNIAGDSDKELVGAPSSGACWLFFDFYGFKAISNQSQIWGRHGQVQSEDMLTQIRTLYKRK